MVKPDRIHCSVPPCSLAALLFVLSAKDAFYFSSCCDRPADLDLLCCQTHSPCCQFCTLSIGRIKTPFIIFPQFFQSKKFGQDDKLHVCFWHKEFILWFLKPRGWKSTLDLSRWSAVCCNANPRFIEQHSIFFNLLFISCLHCASVFLYLERRRRTRRLCVCLLGPYDLFSCSLLPCRQE